MPDSTNVTSIDRKKRHEASFNDYFVDEPINPTEINDDERSTGSSVAANTLSSIKEGILNTSSHSKILLFGQFISIVMASLWATQSTLFLLCSLSAPSFSNFWVYLILSVNVIPLYRQGQRIRADNTLPDPPYWILRGTLPLHLSPWRYLCVAFIGVEANYLMMLALRYTTLTSVALFDALAIPSAMVVSAALLKRKYRFAHLLGASICLLGMTINVITDFVSSTMAHNSSAETITMKTITDDHSRDDGSGHYPNKILGDALAVAGGILYGLNDVLAEICVRNYGGVHEYLAILSLWGMVVTATQAIILEREAMVAFFHTGSCTVHVSILLLCAYAFCQVIRKTALAHFLLISEAALLNLSMLTSDLYTAIFSIFAQDILPRPFFFAGLSMVVSGIFMYEMAPSPVGDQEQTHTNARIPKLTNNLPQHTNIAAIEFVDGDHEMRDLRQRNV